jgi:hypothetical protein
LSMRDRLREPQPLDPGVLRRLGKCAPIKPL